MRLLVSCADRPGIVAAVSQFLFDYGANIVRSDQYSTDPEGGIFFMRVEFTLAPERRGGLAERFGLAVAEPFGMTWRIWDSVERKRIVVMVSRYDHCLYDLLWRWRRGELEAEIVMVVSNHTDFQGEVERFALPFHHIPVTKDTKPEAEASCWRRSKAGRPDRARQVHADPVGRVLGARRACPVINIHHSFLPAFAGPSPYERAKDRGVKLIGATAHYVTEELDAGPIIEQGVTRVSHADDVAALTLSGAEIERQVLARAVQAHCQDRVLRHGNTTVVF